MRFKCNFVLSTVFLCIIFSYIGVVLTKRFSSEEEPDYYPRVNPNPNKIEELNVNDISQYFDLFTRFYEIEYKDTKHENDSYNTFTDNVKRIIIMNKFTAQAKFGINEFSHLTLEEFSDKYTGFNDTGIDDRNVKYFSYNSTQGTPPLLDWRILGISPVVRHQGPCKSSYVFSALANIEAQVSKHFNILPVLSEQQAYDCEPTGSCKYGGMPHRVMESLMKVGGVEEQMSYIYDPSDQRECKVNASLMIIRITNIVRLKPAYEDSLVALLALYGPLVTTIYVSESVKNYYRGILQPTDCDKKPNHAVLVVGYGVSDDKVPYWILKNSWGKLWGENGYFRLVRGVWACHIGEYVVTSIVEPIVRETTTTTTTTESTTTKTASTTRTIKPVPITDKKGPIPLVTRLPESVSKKPSASDSSESEAENTNKLTTVHIHTVLRTTLGYDSKENLFRKENKELKVDSSESDKNSRKSSRENDNSSDGRSDSDAERGPLTGVIEDEVRLRALASTTEDTSEEMPIMKDDHDMGAASEYKVVLTDKKIQEAKEKEKRLQEEEEKELEDENIDKDIDSKKSGSSSSYETELEGTRVTQAFFDING